MKVLQINTVYGVGSTGKIALGIHDVCKKKRIQCQTAYRYIEKNEKYLDTIVASSWLDCHIHNRLARITKLQGSFSFFKTKQFLKKVENYDPDLIHLHNIHGNYINLKLLFRYIKKKKIPVVWTLHDCWAFTGYCPHFTLSCCERWKTSCKNCPLFKNQSKIFSVIVEYLFQLKKKCFTGIDNMVIVTPSKWLADLVKQSFLKEYKIKIINNGIDLTIFNRKYDSKFYNQFRKKFGIDGNPKIILGVSFGWSKSKGVDVFIHLANKLSSEEYRIVLVGTNEEIDACLPKNVISIHRTKNQEELAKIYNIADLFVNPTREENYPTVNMEAIACGTPVISFKTGGSPEIIDKSTGTIVDCDDLEGLEKAIINACEQSQFSKELVLEDSKKFDMNDRFEEYIKLYENITYNTKRTIQ